LEDKILTVTNCFTCDFSTKDSLF